MRPNVSLPKDRSTSTVRPTDTLQYLSIALNLSLNIGLRRLQASIQKQSVDGERDKERFSRGWRNSCLLHQFHGFAKVSEELSIKVIRRSLHSLEKAGKDLSFPLGRLRGVELPAELHLFRKLDEFSLFDRPPVNVSRGLG